MAIKVTPTIPKAQKFPVTLILLIIGALIFSAIAFLFFLKPEVTLPEKILDKFLPKEANIKKIETIDLNVEDVVNNPVFKTLQEFGPIPIRIPATGKTNPFI